MRTNYQLPFVLNKKSIDDFIKTEKEVKDRLLFLSKQLMAIKMEELIEGYNHKNINKIKNFSFSFSQEYDDEGSYYTSCNTSVTFDDENAEDFDLQDAISDVLSYAFSYEEASNFFDNKEINTSTCLKDLYKLLFTKEELDLIEAETTKNMIKKKVSSSRNKKENHKI